MFGRIFHRGKDENSGAKGPPGHRLPQGGGGNGGGAEEHAAPVGGGFFNLPPTGGQAQYGQPIPSTGGQSQYGQPMPPTSGQAPYGQPMPPTGGQAPYGQPLPPSGGAQYGHSSAVNSHSFGSNSAPGFHPSRASGPSNPPFGAQHPPTFGANAPSGYGQAPPPQPPSTFGQAQVPSYGGNHVPNNNTQGGGPPGGSPAGGMFGGMSIKSNSGAPAPFGIGAAPVGGGSLFSGLELGTAASTEEPERRKSGTSARHTSYNYLDNVTADAQRSSVTGGGSTHMSQRTGSINPTTSNKVVKKKKNKSFRPGFGRQLSDESIAALQRGELNEDELMSQPATQTASTTTVVENSPPPRTTSGIASSATDLAHLLPPVRTGSVLAGLTVHNNNSMSGGGGGGVLAGLTVHSTPSPPSTPIVPVESGSETHGVRLSGGGGDASTSVILPSSSQEPEKVVVPPTPEERLLNTLRDFHASASTFRTQTSKQNEEENRIIERKIQLSKQLSQYEMDLHAVEQQQTQACEEEEFEKADALNTTLNSIRHCITLTESDVRKIENELSTFYKLKEKAFSNQVRSTRGTLKELEKFREDQEMERTMVCEEFKKYQLEETERLKLEGDRIETELHHVRLNLDHLKSEKQEIETSIEEQCLHEMNLRNELVIQRAQVEKEVEELQRQLQIKLDEMQGIQASIDKAESEIDVVRNRYARQLKRIADREEGILKTKKEVEDDAEQLLQQKSVFSDTIHGYEEQIVAFGKRMTSVKMEMRAAMQLASVLEVQEQRREQGIVRKKQQAAELTSLSDAAVIAEQSFVMLKKQHDELEKSMLLHKNAIASAESMIPTLEQEKKAAATQRNFKEAARISKDIKALEKDQATAEEMVEVVEMELQDLKERIGKREVEFKEKKEEWKQVEKRLELATLHELWKEAKSLRKALRQIERIKSDGIAVEDGIDFKTSALLLVQAEYDACMVQIEALEERYDVHDPSNEEEAEEDEDEEEVDEASVDDDEVERMTDLTKMKSNSMSVLDDRHGDDMDIGTSSLEEIEAKLKELEALIEKATENEDYDLAAKLDEKIETLRRHHQSIQTLMPHGSGALSDDDEDDEEDEEEEADVIDQGKIHIPTHSPVKKTVDYRSEEELETDLRLVKARITMMEADIERATENDDYDTAAELDESVEGLRQELATIEELLANVSSRSNDEQTEVEDAVVQMPPLPMPLTSTSMFSGLTVSTSQNDKTNSLGSIESPMTSPSRKSSDAKIATSPQKFSTSPRKSSVSSPHAGSPPVSESMFSGLTVSTSQNDTSSTLGSTGSPMTSPSRKSSDAKIATSPQKFSTSSRKASVSSPHAGSPPVSVSMFSGLTVSSQNDTSSALGCAGSPIASSSRKSSDAKFATSPQKFSTSPRKSSVSSPGGEASPVPPATQSAYELPLPTSVSPTANFGGIAVSLSSSNIPGSPSSLSPTRTFSGLKVDATSPIKKTLPSPVSSPVSMFAGLMVSTSSTDDLSAASSLQIDESKLPLSSPRRVSLGSRPNSPRRKSSGGMFGALQVSGGSLPNSPRSPRVTETMAASPRSLSLVGDVAVSPNDTTPFHSPVDGGSSSPYEMTSSTSLGVPSIFGGLQVSRSEDMKSGPSVVESSSMFAGLAVTNMSPEPTPANDDDNLLNN